MTRSVPPSAGTMAGRLPTVSASQALREAGCNGPSTISTGLDQLDSLLAGDSSGALSHSVFSPGGVSRGQLVELYGAPGSGKTALAVQICASALSSGDRVSWIDCASRLPAPRLERVVSALTTGSSEVADRLKRLSHIHCPSLAHLLALLKFPPANFPPSGTGLVIVENLSSLLELAYPRNVDALRNFPKADQGKWAGARRNAVISDLASQLTKLAAMKQSAVIVTTQTMTRFRGEASAILRPVLDTPEWVHAAAARVVLFRDWAFDGQADKQTDAQGVRFAGVIKGAGLGAAEAQDSEWMLPFEITAVRLHRSFEWHEQR